MSTTTAVKLPFSKLKLGMRVQVGPNNLGEYSTGRLLAKHNGSKTVTVRFDSTGKAHDRIPVGIVEVLPPDPLDQIHPMLAKNVEDYKTLTLDEMLSDDDWWAEEKFDGERQILTYVPFHDTGDCPDYEEVFRALPGNPGDYHYAGNGIAFRASTRVVGKNTGTLGVNSTKLAHLADLPVPTTGPTVFDGELIHPKGFQALRSIMGSSDELAVQKQEENGRVRAVLFDVLWFGGHDLRQLPYWKRREVLLSWYEEAVEWEKNRSSEAFPYVDIALTGKDEKMKRRLLHQVQEAGGEGIMLKHKDGVYTDSTLPGQRSPHLLKVKPFQTDEVIIVGFEQGQGEYNTDKFGAIRFAQWVPRYKVKPEMDRNRVKYDPLGTSPTDRLIKENRDLWTHYELVVMGTCSGFDQAEEEAFRKDPDAYIGRVIEVKFQTRWPETGQMRHPSYLRMRDDKAVADCVYHP